MTSIVQEFSKSIQQFFTFLLVKRKGIFFNITKIPPGRILTQGSPFSNMKIIQEYLPMLDPIFLWTLGAKICPIPVLTLKVTQGQIL